MHPQSPTFGAEASHSAFCSPPRRPLPLAGALLLGEARVATYLEGGLRLLSNQSEASR